jgi:hypothetical protein
MNFIDSWSDSLDGYDQPVAWPLPIQGNTNTDGTWTDIRASSVIRTHDPSVKRAKTVHALDRAATVIGPYIIIDFKL